MSQSTNRQREEMESISALNTVQYIDVQYSLHKVQPMTMKRGRFDIHIFKTKPLQKNVFT
jgi:hypothetical protein